MAVTINGTTGITSPSLSVDSPTLVVDDVNNRVGIGFSNPTSKLQIDGDILIRTSTAGMSNQSLSFSEGGSGNSYAVRIGHTANTALAFERYDQGWSEMMRIVGNGNVGIGDTNPNDKLTVHRSNIGNPTGITIRNTEASSQYSHARLRLESQNGAAYGEIWADVANAGLRLGYNSSSTVKIDSSGNIHLQNNSGIDFSASGNAAGMTSELLNDYEEGTWTPNIGGESGLTFGGVTSSGYYVKIGKLIYIQGTVSWTSNSGPGGAIFVMGGIPYSIYLTQGIIIIPVRSEDITYNFAVAGSCVNPGDSLFLGPYNTTLFTMYIGKSGNCDATDYRITGGSFASAGFYQFSGTYLAA